MRAHNPRGSIVLNEFQWMHHTNAIAAMISSSVGICDRGDGITPGGRGRQRACMPGVGGGSEVGRATFEEDGMLFGICNPPAESFGSDMAEELSEQERIPVSLRLTRNQLPRGERSRLSCILIPRQCRPL